MSENGAFKLNFAPANDRGFLRADFKDRNGDACSIQESSLATEECIWLGQNEGTHHHVTGNCMARMHLNRDQAREIGRALLGFAETGKLGGEDAPQNLQDRVADLQQERDDAIRQRDETRFIGDKIRSGFHNLEFIHGLAMEELSKAATRIAALEGAAAQMAAIVQGIEKDWNDGCLCCGYKQHKSTCSLNSALEAWQKVASQAGEGGKSET